VEIEHPVPAFTDHRGDIVDILKQEPIEYVTMISSRKGAIRGNHYHRETTQWLYLLEGTLKLLSKMPGEAVRKMTLATGDLIVNRPMESHTMIAMEDARFMVFTRGPRGGADYERDTFRLDVGLEVADDPG